MTTLEIGMRGRRLLVGSNWDNRRIASMNASADQTQTSYERIADLLAEKKAEFWISHDKPQSTSQKRSPQFYD